ncbi:MAG: hypothetical protein A3B10_04325 [Candidatus Doudnabacteria bacterium RIFCSPLOWO2_01_FULL_44_21]|uniref:ABC transporter ATP-binding protein n=1 Tax=Candidatus Doudnabacteria bacterium RIFCSPLOWO2_01_FULL_44_21 TaxID=1817841 RepID=A0A1F5PYP9_9BACT|nr:MAG: hypothetical protein A3B95_01290 [Candidatus Doudnabacteria bacterium RIFCSPHIGHO2_02_FULL_43_13b]OGE94710.1 MAG: hypothetical protein A3B10_04325 [Candidatus Doudnabacteria bacterium RIFCSPLOWO2_01_FULL_44_21]
MKKATKQTLRIYWQHSKRYPWAFFALSVSILLAWSVDSYVPFLYRRLFNQIAGSSNYENLMHVVWLILGFQFIIWGFWRIATFTNNFFQPIVMRDLLNTCFEYLHNHAYSFFTNNFAGSLVKKVGRYERAFEDIADQIFWNIFPAVFKIALVLVILYFVQPILSVVVLVWSVLYWWFSVAFARYKLRFDIENAAMDTKVGGRLADTITNNITIKLFGGTKKELTSFQKLNHRLYKIRKWTWDLGSINEAIQGALMALLEFATLYFAIGLWRKGVLTIGDFALIQAYLIQIFNRLWDLGRHIKNLYSRLADAEEMTEILTTPHEVQDAQNARPLQVRTGKIEFVDVNFGYLSEQSIFRKFNLVIQPGERVALIGPSGGGKTTIVKLLFRFFDLQGGKILIDGLNIALVTQDSLRANLSLVPQDPILFHRSLYDNIAYARPQASKQEVYEAARFAHADEFIRKFSQGYETFVGERGVKLSGGERQRVAIARAILKNAPVLVLDEATSSLDSESELLIQDALKNLMKGKTTIVIAHRLSTIMQMDRIIVIDNGKVVEEGKHKELLKAKQGVYQKLWEIQAGGFAK